MSSSLFKTILTDQELWSLLNGYGPNRHLRVKRNMTEEERGAFIMKKLREATKDFKASADLKLVIELVQS